MYYVSKCTKKESILNSVTIFEVIAIVNYSALTD